MTESSAAHNCRHSLRIEHDAHLMYCFVSVVEFVDLAVLVSVGLFVRSSVE